MRKEEQGVTPSGPGSRASHEAAGASSPEASIPNAVYSTYVLRHKSEADARRVFGAIMRRWPFMEDKRTTCTAWSSGNAISVTDAAVMALECQLLAHSEREELALTILGCTSWEQCQKVFAEWDLEIAGHQLVDLREAEESSEGGAK